MIHDKRFVLVTGKGGVGKTTVCAAEAMALAKRGKRTLVAMCNAKERLSVMLGVPPIGSDVVPVGEGIWAVNIEPQSALEEYGRIVFHSRTVSRTLFHNRYVRAFLRAVPGIQEWAMLGKAWWHTTERRQDGAYKYDVVLLDAPATGHGLDMLRVPKVILDVVPAGILRRDAERAWKLLQDRATSGIVLVTAPEEMPTTETLELAAALGELGLPIAGLIVNGVLPALFSASERSALAQVTGDAKQPGEEVLLAGRDRAIRESAQEESLARLARELQSESVVLPLLMRDAANPAAIAQLAEHL